MGLILNATTTNAGSGGGGGGGGGITIQEADGTPSVSATVLKYPNNSLTVDGTTVSVDEYPAPLGVNGANLNSFASYLRAGYTFNDASGSLTDSVGVPHDLAVAGSSATYLASGKNGTAIDFSGATTHFKRPPQGFSPGTNEYTLNWWFKSTDVTTTGALLHWHSSTIGTYYYNGKIALHDGSWHYGPTTLSTATWYMLTWQRVKDGGSYYNRVYINGVQEINVLDTVADLESYSLYVGYSGGASNGGTYYNAPLTADELLFYTGPDGYGAISSAAIAELYNSGSGVFLDTVGTPSGLGFSHADLVGYNSYLHDYWKFEEPGTPLIDSISNNSLAASGPTVYGATGKNNNCIQVTAPANYLTRTGSFLHKADQEYTFSIWVNPSNVSANSNYVYSMYNSISSRSSLEQFGTKYRYQNVFGGTTTYISSPTITNGTWYHIVITKTQSGGNFEMNFYLNGVSAGSFILAASKFQDASTSTLGIGNSPVGFSSWGMSGKLDECAYWKGVSLDSAAVTALYNAGAGRFLESI